MHYTIDPDKLSIGDLVALQDVGNDIRRQIEILRKCVTVPDGQFEDIPARHFKKIVTGILSEMNPDLGN
jgi:hypothetical protein